MTCRLSRVMCIDRTPIATSVYVGRCSLVTTSAVDVVEMVDRSSVAVVTVEVHVDCASSAVVMLEPHVVVDRGH